MRTTLVVALPSPGGKRRSGMRYVDVLENQGSLINADSRAWRALLSFSDSKVAKSSLPSLSPLLVSLVVSSSSYLISGHKKKLLDVFNPTWIWVNLHLGRKGGKRRARAELGSAGAFSFSSSSRGNPCCYLLVGWKGGRKRSFASHRTGRRRGGGGRKNGAEREREGNGGSSSSSKRP